MNLVNPEVLAGMLIKRGEIFHSEDLFLEEVDHPKFFLILGENETYYAGFFYINSEPYYKIRNKPALMALQYKIYQRDYPFLTKSESIIGCEKIHYLEKSKMIDSMLKKNTQRKATLLESDEENILNMVLASDIFDQSEKDTFFK